MDKADESSPKGPGFDLHSDLKINSVYSMAVMTNSPMTTLTFNRMPKSEGRT